MGCSLSSVRQSSRRGLRHLRARLLAAGLIAILALAAATVAIVRTAGRRGTIRSSSYVRPVAGFSVRTSLSDNRVVSGGSLRAIVSVHNETSTRDPLVRRRAPTARSLPRSGSSRRAHPNRSPVVRPAGPRPSNSRRARTGAGRCPSQPSTQRARRCAPVPTTSTYSASHPSPSACLRRSRSSRRRTRTPAPRRRTCARGRSRRFGPADRASIRDATGTPARPHRRPVTPRHGG